MKEQINFSFLENEFFPSPFNYAGQKFPELQELFSLFPKDKETLVDLFVGGGSVAINSGYKNIIINDKLTTLIDFYKELHDLSFEQLIGLDLIKKENLIKLMEKEQLMIKQLKNLKNIIKELNNLIKLKFIIKILMKLKFLIIHLYIATHHIL